MSPIRISDDTPLLGHYKCQEQLKWQDNLGGSIAVGYRPLLNLLYAAM